MDATGRRYWRSLRRVLPFLRWQHRVTKATVQDDLTAGITGAALVLPQGVAFATIAGMPPEYGLYASIVPAIIAALFGSSWHLVSGPTTAASIVMYSALSVHAAPGSDEYILLALTLTFMVGVIQLLMGFVRLGALVNFISHSVIVGFTAGAAILIASKQIKNLLGLDIPTTRHVHEIFVYVWHHLSEIDPLVCAVAAITMGSIAGLRILRPSFPGMIAGLLVGSLVAVLLNWALGESRTGIKMIGALPRQLPPLSTPSFSIEVIRDLGSVAVAMTLFALTEAVSIARSISLRSGQAIDGNQEFIGQGLSNIVGSFFSAYVATGSFNRSGANYEAGAKTPLAAVFAAVLLLVIILAIAPLTAYLPKAAMAGILLLVAWRLIDFYHIKAIARADRTEATVMVVTFVSTLLFELDFAILLGVMLSLMIYLRRTSRPKVVPRVPDPESPQRKFTSNISLPECPQLKLLRIDESLYFGSVAHVREMFRRFREHYPDQKHLLLLTKGINQVDISGAELLSEEASIRRALGGGLYMYRLKESASKVLERGGYIEKLGKHNIYDSKEEGIRAIFDRLDRSICEQCEKRIFLECKSLPKSSTTTSDDVGPDPRDTG